MKKLIQILCIAIVPLCSSCSNDNDDNVIIDSKEDEVVVEPTPTFQFVPIQLDSHQKDINANVLDFSWDVFSKVANEVSGETFLLSPVSLNINLAMDLNTHSDLQDWSSAFSKFLNLEGYTVEDINSYYKKMVEGLSQSDEVTVFKSANSFWYTDNKETYNTFGPNNTFIKTIEDVYDAYTKESNFADPETKDVINSWCEKQTEGRIKNLMELTDKDDVYYLINASYFKSHWKNIFVEGKTDKQPFHTAMNGNKDVDMMFYHNNARYKKTDDYSMVILDFDGPYEYVAVMPEEGKDISESMANIMSTTNTSNVGECMLELRMPKFEVSYKLDKGKLGAVLEDVWKSQNGDENIKKFNLFQKTFFKVDEKCAEAAAATVNQGIGVSGAKPDVEYLSLDHPFYFAILENNTHIPVIAGHFTGM